MARLDSGSELEHGLTAGLAGLGAKCMTLHSLPSLLTFRKGLNCPKFFWILLTSEIFPPAFFLATGRAKLPHYWHKHEAEYDFSLTAKNLLSLGGTVAQWLPLSTKRRQKDCWEKVKKLQQILLKGREHDESQWSSTPTRNRIGKDVFHRSPVSWTIQFHIRPVVFRVPSPLSWKIGVGSKMKPP